MDIKSSQPNHSNPQWYIFRDCHQHGPLTSEEICDLLAKNQITKDHHIWHIDFNDWVAINEVDVFKNVGFSLQFSEDQNAFIENKQTPELKLKNSDFEADKVPPTGFWAKVISYFK